MMDVMLAVGILDDAKGLGEDLEVLMKGTVLVVMYLAMVVMTAMATNGSVVKTLVAAVGGAVLLGIVLSQASLSSKTQEEVEKDHSAPAPVVRVVPAPGGEFR